MPSVAPPAEPSETQPHTPTSAARRSWIPLAVSWLFGATWIWIFLLRQWVPHDEGAFADMADRVLRGEVPHRDFVDLYTGGLAYLHGFAWRVFGRNLAAFRYVLFAFSLVWLPALYYIASRFVRPVVAASLVAIASIWSLPNYPAAVPSWYNLFFATWGTAALFKFSENSSRRWLFIAGLCGGMSFLAKVSGLFFVFAALLFLVYRSQQDEAQKGQLSSALRCATVIVVIGAVVRVVSGWLTRETLVYYILPTLVLSGMLLVREERILRGARRGYSSAFTDDLLALGVGALIPAALYATVYLEGGFTAWLNGVFVLPARRLQFAESDPPPLYAIALALGIWAICTALLVSRRRVVQLLGIAALTAVVVLAYSQELALQTVWYSLAAVIPLVIVAAGVFSRGSERVFLLAAVVALCSLVQFPYSVPLYFCYIAPLVVILIAAVFKHHLWLSRFGAVAVLLFYAYAGIALMNTGSIYSLANYYDRVAVRAHLSARGAEKLSVLPEQADLYNPMISLVQEHARGEYVYASPSMPEVYFLSAHRNPTHWTFDFFDDHARDAGFISAMLERDGVNVVVVNTKPDFDPPPSAEMMAMYQSLYPHEQTFGRFQVRWRE